MFEKLVEQIITELKQEPILLNAFDIAHDPKNTKLVWWYNLTTGQFESEDTDSHLKIIQNKKLQIDRSWIKGRVFEWQNETYLIIYSRTFLHDHISKDAYREIFYEVYKALPGVHVKYIIDDLGFEINEKKQ